RFNLIGGEVGSREATVLAAELISGDTGMGFRGRGRGWVQADFHAWYALVSHKYGRSRVTARLDQFATFDRDHSIAESNDEHGRAWTLAWLYEFTQHWRVGMDFTNATGARPAAAQSGAGPNMDGRKFIAETRYGWKSQTCLLGLSTSIFTGPMLLAGIVTLLTLFTWNPHGKAIVNQYPRIVHAGRNDRVLIV